MGDQDKLWDYYSGLPNPLWYEQQSKIQDEEDYINIDEITINRTEKE
jgi:hypothetical protein